MQPPQLERNQKSNPNISFENESEVVGFAGKANRGRDDYDAGLGAPITGPAGNDSNETSKFNHSLNNLELIKNFTIDHLSNGTGNVEVADNGANDQKKSSFRNGTEV